MRWLSLSILLIFIGILTVTAAITVDILFNGTPGYGWKQLCCLVIGPPFIVAGIRMLPIFNKKKLELIIILSYLAGVVVMGTKPEAYGLDYSYAMFSFKQFSLFDFFINISGFIPIGYLFSDYICSNFNKRKKDAAFLACVFGSVFSLIIEALQFLFLSSRVASVYDFIANGSGAFIGSIIYSIIGGWEYHIRKNILYYIKSKSKHENSFIC